MFKMPYNEETKEIEFKSIKTFSNIDKKTIYDRSMEWIAEKFGSLESVLHYSNPEDGKIILKGWFEVYYRNDIETFFSIKKEKILSVKCNFTYVFTIKDNKLKMEVIDIKYEYYVPYTLAGNLYIPSYTYDGPISALYPITNSESVEWKGKLNLLDKTTFYLNSYFGDVERYIKNKSTDYDL